MSFAGLSIIIQIDDIYTDTVQDLPFGEILEKGRPKFTKTKD